MKKVTIYTRPLCGHCARALALLKSKGADVTEISAAFEKAVHEEMVNRANGAATYPQIFIGDLHVGGNEELAALERAGELDALFDG